MPVDVDCYYLTASAAPDRADGLLLQPIGSKPIDQIPGVHCARARNLGGGNQVGLMAGSARGGTSGSTGDQSHNDCEPRQCRNEMHDTSGSARGAEQEWTRLTLAYWCA